MNKMFNKADLSGAIVLGRALQYPRKPAVFVGNDNNGYERGDLADANAIIDIVADAIAHDDHKELKSVKQDLQKEIQDRYNEDISLAKSILNYAVKVDKTSLPDSNVFTIRQGDYTAGIINVPKSSGSISFESAYIENRDGTLYLIIEFEDDDDLEVDLTPLVEELEAQIGSASTINAGTERTSITGKPAGYMYYDTLLDIVTVYDGTNWKDCDGNLIK